MFDAKKVLGSLVVVGCVSAAVGFGTFASFNATATNPGSFETGTIVLSNTKAGGTACLSTGAGTVTDTNAATCDSLFGLTLRKPLDASTARLAVQNAGSLAAAAFTVASAACTDGDAAGETFHGTGRPCDAVQVYVQRYSDGTYSTPSACVFGGGTATTCDHSDTTRTLDALVAAGPVSMGGLAAGETAYFEVGLRLPDVGNAYQGRQAVTSLTWTIAQ